MSDSPSKKDSLSCQSQTNISIIQYDEETFRVREKDMDQIASLISEHAGVTWIDMVNAQNRITTERLLCSLHCHPLVSEYFDRIGQRPTIEDFGDYILIILQAASYDKTEQLQEQRIGIIIGKKFVLSIQRQSDDLFLSLKNDIALQGFHLRRQGADFLGYTLIEKVLSSYYVVLERMEDHLDHMEDEIIRDPNQSIAHKLFVLKRDLTYLLKSVWPLREIISILEQGIHTTALSKQVHPYFRALSDRIFEIIDTIELFKDTIAGLIETYLSSINNRINDVMKVLTVITTIFMPISFIAGVYGMNFKHMPELEWGYPGIFFLFGFISFLMLLYFKKKKWI